MFDSLRQHCHRLAATLAAAVPSPCALCREDGTDGLCTACRRRFFRGGPARCHRCADVIRSNTGEASMTCGKCLKRQPAFDATVVAADYVPPIDQLVLALKFGANLALAPLFARLLADALFERREHVAMPDVLIAVPLGPSRLAERGFNQALEMAKPLSRALNIALESRLAVRVRETGEQAGLHPDERRKNVRGAFTLSAESASLVKGKHVGVVDDVITTGETLDALAVSLKRFGAVRVTNLVFARTPP